MSCASRLTEWNVAKPGHCCDSDTDAASSPYGSPAALAAAAQYSLYAIAATTVIAPPAAGMILDGRHSDHAKEERLHCGVAAFLGAAGIRVFGLGLGERRGGEGGRAE